MNHDIKQFESEKEHKISKKKQEQQMWAQFLKTQMSMKKERMQSERLMHQTQDSMMVTSDRMKIQMDQ